MKTFDHHTPVLYLTAGIEPEDAEAQSGVDHGLRLLGVDAKHGERGLPFPQQCASVNRAE